MQKDARHEAIVRKLLDRQVEDRDAREKRLLGYKQTLKQGAPSSGPDRLHRFRTKVPCRATLAALDLLDELAMRNPGATISFLRQASRRQAIILTDPSGSRQRQIGWLEHEILADTESVEDSKGLFVDTDGGAMLLMRFQYPRTSVKVAAHMRTGAHATAASYSEIRAALDLPRRRTQSPPPLVWIARPEVDAFDDVGFRDFESFYVRFKHELQSGLWDALNIFLASTPGSHWHAGSCYNIERTLDRTNGRIHQHTVDDGGFRIDLGIDRTFDASAATDILLLYLEADILADFADIYFTLLSQRSDSAAALREEFFARIAEFWAATPSLAYQYGSEVATVTCIAQRALPTPVQTLLLKQDWVLLRQRMIDRFGEAGWNASQLRTQNAEASSSRWGFAVVPPGAVNLALRFTYLQGQPPAQPAAPAQTTTALSSLVEAAKRCVDADGSFNIGIRSLGVATDLGYDTATWPAAIQNVVMIAEPLPAPGEIDRAWVIKHDWILSKALLDESFRDVLGSIIRPADASGVAAAEFEGVRGETFEHIDVFTGAAIASATGVELDGEWKRGYRYRASQQIQRVPGGEELQAMRERLYEHIRNNILHYQHAIWQHEDPQQRCLRYRECAARVPLDWLFEIEAGATTTIEELGSRLNGSTIDGHFAAYSSGRAASLDELIDPGAPLGYYGNYAIYAMRPEYGTGEFFSMLHFFKSMYLPAGTTLEDTVEEAPVIDVPDIQRAPPLLAAPPAAPEVFELVLGDDCMVVVNRWDHEAGMTIAAVNTSVQNLSAGGAGVGAEAIADLALSAIHVARAGCAATQMPTGSVITNANQHLHLPCAGIDFTGIESNCALHAGTPARGISARMIIARPRGSRRSVIYSGARRSAGHLTNGNPVIVMGDKAALRPSPVTV